MMINNIYINPTVTSDKGTKDALSSLLKKVIYMNTNKCTFVCIVGSLIFNFSWLVFKL